MARSEPAAYERLGAKILSLPDLRARRAASAELTDLSAKTPA